MYALTGNYKTDQVHAPALLRTAGDGTMTRLAFAPLIPLSLLTALVVAIALLITVYRLYARARAARWRAGLAFAMLLFALAGPILVNENACAPARRGGDGHRPLPKHGRGQARGPGGKRAGQAAPENCWRRNPI